MEGASGTHVFISDADTTDKIEEQMFNTLGGGGLPHPSGKISIWEPRQETKKRRKYENEEKLIKWLTPKKIDYILLLRHEEINAEEAISKLDEFSTEELNSSYKIYCPQHLLEHSNQIRWRQLPEGTLN